MTSPVPSPYPGSLCTSVPRASSTARLASPVPHRAPTPGSDSNAPGSDIRSGSLTPLAGPGGDGAASTAGPGVSALATALSHSFGSSPPRHGTPSVARPTSPGLAPPSTGSHTALTQLANGGGPGVGVSTPPNYGSFDSRLRQDDLEATRHYEDAEIVRRHLVQPSDAASLSGESAGNGGRQLETTPEAEEDEREEFSSLRLQGGDITRGIYKWTEEAEARQRQPRRNSFNLLRPEPEDEVLDITSIKVPGGFRRDYLRRAGGSDSPSPPPTGGATGPGPGAGRGAGAGAGAGARVGAGAACSSRGESGAGRHRAGEYRQKLPTSNFIEFLTLYGHFAGEELEEDDEVLGPDEYFASGDDGTIGDSDDDESGGEEREPMEDSALLTPSRRRRRRKARGGSGTNSPTSAALLLLKSFVGTGVLFLPRAYLNGGMLFSNLVLLGVAALSYYSFVLLVTTRLRVEGSFGDIGGILYGPWMRALILTSIVVSQIGFVAAYVVFTAENLRAVILAVTDCATYLDVKWLIIAQMAVFLPFSLLRDIGKLGITALVADAFILVGLAYLFYYDILTLSTAGLADVIMFNRRDWTLFIGTAIFTFEGIGLIIPIQESMRHPTKFPRVLGAVMIVITTLFVVMGAVSYAAYGSNTKTVVLLNLPQDSRLVNGVQLLYSVAILLSTPLQIFPAIRITENALFTRSGKYNPYIKWQKNGYRFLVVAMCMAIAWGGSDNLDKFVALVGNFACIPLCFIYPPLLHYRAVARGTLWKASDIALCIFGVIAMTYTTTLTVMSWASAPSGPSTPEYCNRTGGGGH